jgi:hypothetical protein
MSSTSLGAEEAIKHALNVVEMLFFDVATSFEVIPAPFRRPLVGEVTFLHLRCWSSAEK